MTIKHHFLNKLYLREAKLPAGQPIKIHRHKFDHISVLAEGTVRVVVDGKTTVLEAPAYLLIPAGKVHGVLALTDVLWYCVHATSECDAETIDSALVEEGEI